MDAILGASRLLLSIVFLIAGLAKLTDRAGFRETLTAFGVPGRLVFPLGIALPVTELVVAVGLLPVVTARWAALAGLLLLALFSLAISVTLMRGKAPSCRCFGQLSAAPVGPHTLARNGVLVTAAAFVGFGSDQHAVSLFAWVLGLSFAGRLALAAAVTALVVSAALILLLIQILRQQGRLLIRLDTIEAALLGGKASMGQSNGPTSAAVASGLPWGTSAPHFRLQAVNGGSVGLEDLVARGRQMLLVFAHPNCGPCEALMPEIALWQRKYMEVLTIPIISEGSRENQEKISQYGLIDVLFQKDRETAEAYHAYGTPAAVLLTSDCIVDSAVAQGADQIRALVARAVDTGAPALVGNLQHPSTNGGPRSAVSGNSGSRLGEPLPNTRLQQLDGTVVSLKSVITRPSLLVFWDPLCGYCEQMLPELKQWESAALADTPDIVVISRGSIEVNRSLGLRSLILLENTLQLARGIGADGTPMALLVDEEARIASHLVAGKNAVLMLAETRLGKPV